MERREFLQQTAQLTAGGLITASMMGMLGCKPLHDFYSFDASPSPTASAGLIFSYLLILGHKELMIQ